jgi:hypothetical protein
MAGVPTVTIAFARVGSQVQSLSRPPPKPQHSRGFRGSPADTPIPALRQGSARHRRRQTRGVIRGYGGALKLWASERG